MLTKRIIPCLDVDNGRVVKGTKFINIRDAGDPVQVAEEYDRQGADELTFLDITASHEKRNIMLEVVKRVAEKVFLPVTVGGGIKSVEDIRILLQSGADKVSINTAAISNPDFVREAVLKFGSQCIVVAVDAKKRCKNENEGWEVYTHGGRIDTGIDAISWVKVVEEMGAGEILLTSMDMDGTKDGYDLRLTKTVSESVSIPVIASGGVGRLKDIYEGLTIGKADAALAASIFHFGEFTINDVKRYLADRNVPVRLDY